MEAQNIIQTELQKSISNYSLRKKNKEELHVPNGVYVFVSFDLVNSTKFKYRNSHWVDMIKELIKTANNYWFGLDFWKFNGDELLYYTELVSYSQLVLILHKLNEASNGIEDELKQKMYDDKIGVGFESDLIGIKTSIWLAVVSDNEGSLNSKLPDFDFIDFAGINMDEGFRMSKCAIQNKIIVDPKIALIISAIAEEFIGNRIKNLTNNELLKIKEKRNPVQFNDAFESFWVNKSSSNYDFDIQDMFKVVANNFRIVGYEKCKGVWDDRPYPIIWYSDDWDLSISKIKYDEVYNNIEVSGDYINKLYENEKNSYKTTLDILKKIYNNVSAFSLAIRQILLFSNVHLYTNRQLEKQIVSKTYLYHSIVCVNEKTRGFLVFQRSKDRGHMPCVWDFDHQKNAQDTYGASMIQQIEQRFLINFGLTVKVLSDKQRNSVFPIAIHPVYRKGKMHHGIVCVAKIEGNLSEEETIHKIKKQLPRLLSGYGYPLYNDVAFIHEEDIFNDAEKKILKINNTLVYEMTNSETSSDSNTWQNHNKGEYTTNRCTTNMIVTVEQVLNLLNRNDLNWGTDSE